MEDEPALLTAVLLFAARLQYFRWVCKYTRIVAMCAPSMAHCPDESCSGQVHARTPSFSGVGRFSPLAANPRPKAKVLASSILLMNLLIAQLNSSYVYIYQVGPVQVAA